MKKLLALAVVILGFTAVSFGQVSATANSTATILGPLTLTATTPLAFGALSPTAAAGTVTVDPAGVRTGTNVTLSAFAVPSASNFNATGAISTTYAITLPLDNVVKLTDGTPAHDMKVNTFKCSYATNTSTLSAAGIDNFKVGATLSVAASQFPGAYTGTYSVTINYN